ncbi:NADH:flavin oxidoreductase [Undibacterium sp. TJN25]|uniref:NADH:flavin oxidoreductase n=1 Tax=Undibacterium sp. TJN25 TaxID=3413056 RepID=UPI003BF275AD
MKNASPLFTPFSYKSLLLPNRVVMAPMTRRKSPDGIPGPDVAAYYRRRAEGGVGLIITEGTTIDRPSASNDSDIPNFHDPRSFAGWRAVVEAVHAAGGKIAPQLWHQGLLRKPGTGPRPYALSEGPTASGAESIAMSDEAIADTIAAFAKAAGAAKDLGFDAVEVHGAHGYLIDQFLWEGVNRRTDRYGGNTTARALFASEIIKAVRARVGPDFIISQRFSQWRTQDYESKLATTPALLEQILAPLADAGVDIFHASTRRFWEPEFAGSRLNLAGWTKKLTGRPVITVGSVGLDGPDFLASLFGGDNSKVPAANMEALEERLGNGEFDLVAVGRALAGDAQWLQKVREGRLDEIQPFQRDVLTTLS